MIPLSRVDNDDRPAGLKLARNGTGGGGGYAFPSASATTTTTTTAENGTGSFFDDDLRWLDQNSRASIENSSRRLDSGKFQHPYVPARSPFRIRDSQNSVTSNTRAPSTTGTKPFQSNSTKWASPMFESEKPRNIMDNRTSLSVEVARMWKRQPAPTKKGQEPNSGGAKILEEEGMNGLLGQLLVSQALVDAELYDTLTFEQLSDLKKQRDELKERIVALETRWAVDKHVQDVSRSLVQLDRENKTETPSSRAASELIPLLNEDASIRQKILEHTAGALKLGFETFRQDTAVQQQKLVEDQPQQTNVDHDRLQEAKQEIESLKLQLRDTTANSNHEAAEEIRSLKSQIKQLNLASQDEKSREMDRILQLKEESATVSREANEEIRSLKSQIKHLTLANQEEKDREIDRLQTQIREMTVAADRETNEEIRSLKAQIKQLTLANQEETNREVERLQTQVRQMSATTTRETNEEIERLNMRIREMTAVMSSFAERHELRDISERSDEHQWVSTIERQFNDHKLMTRRLERELESSEEKIRLESASSKKYEAQLRVMQDKRDAIEAKYKNLEKEYLDRKLDVDSYNNTSAATAQLENELSRTKRELQSSQEQISSLQSSLAEIEVRCRRAESEASASASRQLTSDARAEKYQAEVSALRAEKQRWERALKRESVLQMMENGSDSFKAKYEQQIEEMKQEYEAELQEQRALLAKTSRAQQQIESERDKMAAVCKDLEDLIRDKSRTIDARDVRINQIDEELKQIKQQGKSMLNNEELAKAQKAFTEREEAWIAQSTSMEANFEGIMKEFERLTMSAMEFETDRMKYEKRIEQLSKDMERMDTELTEERINKLGYDNKEGPTTASLRKEFRQLVNDMKAKQQKIIHRELDEKKSLEDKIKDMKHELEGKRYERVNQSVQTYFVA
ncbi:hypothetical protein BDC45DRAFT_527878 [Circinella umbellata]|nr:hypothetical protein BDC45DRAFT_527878 [Circinella umbellata]